MLQIALRWLEGSTMSNLVHRRRRCARIDLHSTLCLEGSTPEDGFFFTTDLNGFNGLDGFTVRGECALMRPTGLGEYVTGLCSRHVLAFPSDRLTHILPLAGHHKSTIITNATPVLGQPLRSNQADSMSYKNIILYVYWTDGSCLINRKYP